MSPARSKRQAVPHRRSQAEIVQAVAVGTGIVAATALLVWLLRPGPAGIPATGGIMNRQPRASWLVGTGLGVAAIAAWVILRGRHSKRSRVKVLLPVALGVVLVLTVAGGVAWPGGLLRHDIAPAPAPKPKKTTTTTTTPGASTTTKSGSGSGSGSTPTTAATTSTPTTATPTTATPTTATPTTGTPTTDTPTTRTPTTASK
jgi:hypothetical protein